MKKSLHMVSIIARFLWDVAIRKYSYVLLLKYSYVAIVVDMGYICMEFSYITIYIYLATQVLEALG